MKAGRQSHFHYILVQLLMSLMMTGNLILLNRSRLQCFIGRRGLACLLPLLFGSAHQLSSRKYSLRSGSSSAFRPTDCIAGVPQGSMLVFTLCLPYQQYCFVTCGASSTASTQIFTALDTHTRSWHPASSISLLVAYALHTEQIEDKTLSSAVTARESVSYFCAVIRYATL